MARSKSTLDELGASDRRVLSTDHDPSVRIVVDDVADGTHYSVFSYVPYDREAITDLYTASAELPFVSGDSIAHGLRKLTYPDPTIEDRLGREKRWMLGAVRSDATHLNAIIQRSNGIERVAINTPVYTYAQAFLASKEMMLTMKRTSFVKFALDNGYQINELAARAEMGGLRYQAALSQQRSGKYVQPHVIAAYIEYLKRHQDAEAADTLERAYFEIMFQSFDLSRDSVDWLERGGGGPVADDVVYIEAAHVPGYIHPKHTQVDVWQRPTGNRQRIEFQRQILPYSGQPLLSWVKTAEGKRQLTFNQYPPDYSELDRRVFYRSQQLGLLSVNLAYQDIEPDELAAHAARLTERGPRAKRIIPDYAIGTIGLSLVDLYTGNPTYRKRLDERLGAYEGAVR